MPIACIQTNPQDDAAANVAHVLAQIDLAARTGAKTIVLPEVFAYMGAEQGRLTGANKLGEGVFASMSAASRAQAVNLIAGSHAEISPVPGKVYNTAVAYDAKGSAVSVYRKIHLFNLKDTEGKPLYCESDVLTAGNSITGFDLQIAGESWRCLTAICYDLRFPEVFRTGDSVQKPYDVIFLPAAFTHQTGQDHWEVLLRARAIENQCYVVACNQTGFHSGGRKRNFGHSMIIDPWGKVIARLGEEQGILYGVISKEVLNEARTRLPALADRVLK